MPSLNADSQGSPTTVTVGSQIQKLRSARGLSLNGLARQSGVSAATLSRWEAEKCVPSIPELETVLTALEVSPTQKRAILRRMDAPRAVHRLRALDAVGAEAYNGRGQLLWAMRQRKGWTQSVAAAAASVPQAQIARWENGDSWPNAEDLHRLCWCLGASPEEVAALTRHTGNTRGFLLPEEKVQDWDNSRWENHLNHLLFKRPPQELLALTFIGVQEQLTRLAEERSSAAALLTTAHAVYARHCLSLGLDRQASHEAERGLALVRRQLPGLLADEGQTLWFGTVLVLATLQGKSQRAGGRRAAARLLKDWLPAMQRGKESKDSKVAASAAAHHAWGQMKLAGYWSKLGHIEDAIAMGRAACEEGEHVKPAEGYMRLRDLAFLLLEAKEPLSALRVLSHSEVVVDMGTVTHTTRAQHYLLEAECLTAAGATQRAHERIVAAEKIITANGLLHLRTDLQHASSSL